jgi:glyoxylase-like metal-dependent hydrolase (beta-lactamase superfamily II)
MRPFVQPFRDEATSTFSYIVYGHDGGRAAIVDPVLDYDAASGATATRSAQMLLDFVREHGLTVDWILETHAHADHLSAGVFLRGATGARLAIGRGIARVQAHFAREFALPDCDGRPFDRLFDDGDEFAVGGLPARVMATPGHTPDSVSYAIGDAAFIGDTLFAPDTGSARCDFPGGDARTLHASITKLLALPAGTRLFLCHDYPKDREARAEWSIAEQRGNVHLRGGIEDYVALRTARDATLPPPKLLTPALRANLRGGG